MVTNENKNAFKIHKILIDIGNEVIQLSIEYKIRNSNSTVSQFLEMNHNRLREDIQNNRNRNRNYRPWFNIPFKILNELEQKISDTYSNNSNQYPDCLIDFDITMKLAIARNLLNSSNRAEWQTNSIDMNNLNFDKCLNNLRIIRNNLYGHLKNYQISDSDYLENLNHLKVLIKKLVQLFDLSKTEHYEQETEKIQAVLIISTDDFDRFKIDIDSIKIRIQYLEENVELLTNNIESNKIQINKIELKTENLAECQESMQNKVNFIENQIQNQTTKQNCGLVSDTYIETDTIHFIDRDQHQTILEKLVDSKHTDIIILQGIGGIGKTTLAFHLANKLKNEYQYKFKWFSKNDDLNEKYQKILQKEFNYIENDRDYFIDYFSSILNDEQSNILFVFDNVENLDGKENYIFKLPKNVKIIITTRNQELKVRKAFRKSEEFSLDIFKREQAKKFLVTTDEIKMLELSEEKLNEILNDLMPNNIITPFKLNIAVTLIANNETENLKQIMEKLKNNPNEAVYIELLINAFKDNKLPELFLIYFSLLNTSFVEKELFEQLVDKEFDKNQIRDTLELLKKQSLIKSMRKNDVYGYKVHDFIVQTVHERNNKEIVNILFKLIEKMNFFHINNSEDGLIEDYLLIHFDQILKYFLLNEEKIKPINEQNHQYNISLALHDTAVTYGTHVKIDIIKYLNYSKTALEIYEESKINGKNDSLFGSILQNVGLAYGHNGNNEKMLEYSLKSFEIFENLYKDSPHHQMAECYYRVGLAYSKMGDYKNYLDSLKKSLEIYEIIVKQEPDHLVRIFSIKSSIANAFIGNGFYGIGLSLLEEILKDRENIFKDEPYHSDLAITYLDISVAYDLNSDYEKQLSYSLKSLEIFEKIFKNNTEHPDLALPNTHVSQAYINMSKKHYKNADYEKSNDYLLKCLDYSRKSIKIYESCYMNYQTRNVCLEYTLKVAARAYGYNAIYEKQLEYSFKLFEIYEIVYKDNPNDDNVKEATIHILSSIYNICKQHKKKIIKKIKQGEINCEHFMM